MIFIIEKPCSPSFPHWGGPFGVFVPGPATRINEAHRDPPCPCRRGGPGADGRGAAPPRGCSGAGLSAPPSVPPGGPEHAMDGDAEIRCGGEPEILK